MAVSANHNLGGCVIYLRLYLIDIVRKIIGGFRVIVPFNLCKSVKICGQESHVKLDKKFIFCQVKKVFSAQIYKTLLIFLFLFIMIDKNVTTLPYRGISLSSPLGMVSPDIISATPRVISQFHLPLG